MSLEYAERAEGDGRYSLLTHAQSHYQELLRVCDSGIARLGEHYPDTAAARIGVALLDLRVAGVGEQTETEAEARAAKRAEENLRKAVSSLRRTLGPEHFHTLHALRALTEVLSTSPGNAEAAQLRERYEEDLSGSLPWSWSQRTDGSSTPREVSGTVPSTDGSSATR